MGAEKKWDVYILGDINIDLIIPDVTNVPPPGQERETGDMATTIGGGAALFALGLGRLGLHPVFQGVVGNDVYGRYLREYLISQNVDVSLLEMREECKTGITLSFTNQTDRSFLTMRGGNAEVSVSMIDIEMVKKARHFHLTGYAGAKNHHEYLTVLRRIKEETATTVSLDLGWDVTNQWNPQIYELFPYIDVLFMNELEALGYSGKTSAKEAGQDFAGHCKTVALKLGGRGSAAFSGQTVYRKDSYAVKAIDTTGAGDCFNAGFIYGFLAGASLEQCLTYGNACGALSVTGWGGNTNFPDKAELLNFIAGKE